MGYRSDVTLFMKEKDYEMMLSKIDADKRLEVLSTYPNQFYHINRFVDRDKVHYVKLDWHGIKWHYDNLFRYFNDNDSIYFDFIRVGEDYDDIDHECNITDGEDYRLHVWREIDFDPIGLKELNPTKTEYRNNKDGISRWVKDYLEPALVTMPGSSIKRLDYLDIDHEQYIEVTYDNDYQLRANVTADSAKACIYDMVKSGVIK